jgi:YD repeat-containing protein
MDMFKQPGGEQKMPPYPLKTVVVVILVTLLFSCATKEKSGTVVGSTTGAAAGAIIDDGGAGGILLGAVLGGLIGREAGEELDQRDRRQINQALEYNPTGRSSSWQNPDNGRNYQVTPTETFQSNNRPCREFRMDIDGQRDDVRGTACRRSDGSWEIID